MLYLSVYFTQQLISEVSKVKLVCASEVLNTLYVALVESYLRYGIFIWGNRSHSTIIFKIQRRAARISSELTYRDCCAHTFKNLKLYPFSSFILQNVIYVHTNTCHDMKRLTETYQIKANPSQILQLFLLSGSFSFPFFMWQPLKHLVVCLSKE